LRLERYGSLARGTLHLTLRNDTDAPQSGTITLLPQPGNYSVAGLAATEALSGAELALATNPVDRMTTFSKSVAAHGTAMVRIAATAR
jgi:hypothetical protein